MLGILAVFVFVGHSLHQTHGIMFGLVAYLMLALLQQQLIPRHHRKALRHCKRQEYDQAIPNYQKSVEFFRDHEWVDRFRAVTMMSAAGMSYREMGLIGLGFCYAQVGDGLNARRSYEQCLEEFPDNGMAIAALRLMDAAVSSTDEERQ